ncbi:hypothetical protein [Phaffia rhodozyma]|uniref:Uncharacterized protein n=1 Tax=Phaffia rhodozyma TaxID=264483 RepID=A0A0F7SWV6_PHARH|nr:hypothetical protein [Phaffia rhodozyma]
MSIPLSYQESESPVNSSSVSSLSPSSPVSSALPACPTVEESCVATSIQAPLSTPPFGLDRLPRPLKIYPSIDAGKKGRQVFSQSARRRDSVTALGSIESLQHHFTKVSLASDKTIAEGTKAKYGDIEKSGPGFLNGFSRRLPQISLDTLPPSPVRSSTVRAPFPPQPVINVDPESLRPEVVRDLKLVERVFSVAERAEEQQIDILKLLRTTITAVRSVRNYVVTIPEEAFPSRSVPLSIPTSYTGAVFSPSFAVQTNYLSTPSRPAPINYARPSTRISSAPSSLHPTPVDPVSRIRKSALNVLGALRLIEERYRLLDEAVDEDNSEPVLTLHPLGPETTKSLTIPSATSLPCLRSSFSEDLDVHPDDLEISEKTTEKLSWEDRLGHLYQSDVTLASSQPLQDARKAVEDYLSLVDDVLFGGGRVNNRGWDSDMVDKGRRKRRLGGAPRIRTTTEIGRPRINEEDKENIETDPSIRDFSHAEGDEADEEWLNSEKDIIVRLHSLLSYHLPPYLATYIPPLTSPLPDFLNDLTDGQLLCYAHNFAVRRSRKPWGFIPDNEIHDVIGERERNQLEPFLIDTVAIERSGGTISRRQSDGLVKHRKEYLFRRVQNMGNFAAAIKLRYLVPLIQSNAVNPTPESIFFDHQMVAKRAPGWEQMLEKAIHSWIDRITEEERDDTKSRMEGN